MEVSTRFRVYSMTKPITAAAALTLAERGVFPLDEPVESFLPAFRDVRVWDGFGRTRKPRTPLLVRHLLTHTSGLASGSDRGHAVDALYRSAGIGVEPPRDMTSDKACEVVARLPLLFDPGAAWNYSLSSDVLGWAIEAASGVALDQYIASAIFEPIGMHSASFALSPDDASELATFYSARGVPPAAVRNDEHGAEAMSPRRSQSGGGGMICAAADMTQFAQMLVAHGEINGFRVLDSTAVDLMTSNQLPAGADLRQCARPFTALRELRGLGFGFGLAVVTDPKGRGEGAPAGEFGWDGSATTSFFADPTSGLSLVFLSQLHPVAATTVLADVRSAFYESTNFCL